MTGTSQSSPFILQINDKSFRRAVSPDMLRMRGGQVEEIAKAFQKHVRECVLYL